MSGTSLDGVDAVLVDISDTAPLLLGSYYRPFPDDLRNSLLNLHFPSGDELHKSHLVSNELAQLYADAVSALLSQTGTSNAQITAIGCHGQTIRHRPELGYSIQIGNAAMLAELTGITVVNDFRSRDIAASGQGAPLVPAFHEQIFRDNHAHRVIVNIGGISNLTNLPPNGETTGFDCGPGNLLLDAWCTRHLSQPFDKGGRWAASGKVQSRLLARMLDDPFFSLPPPKSSGRDLFHMSWLENLLSGDEVPADVQATLLELTCLTISQSINQHCTGCSEVYLCGGGAQNSTLTDRLASLLPDCKLQTTNHLDVDSDFLEAIAFAWLARQTMHNRPSNLPQVTGARHFCVLGAIHPA